MQPLWPKKSADIIPLFKTFRIGAVLAYSLSKYDSSLKGRELIKVLLDRKIPREYRQIPPNSNVLLSFGEIDCRAHIIRNGIKWKRDVETIIEDTVGSYFSVIYEIKELGYNPIVWGVIPSGHRKRFAENKEFPAFGTCQERNYITKLFNNYLKRL